MNSSENTFGWEIARYGKLLLNVLGEYPSFHDSSIRSFCMRRARRSLVDDKGSPLPPGCDRDLVDLTLEIAHNRYGPRPSEGNSDYLVTVNLLNITTGEIDINAMLEEAWIRDINLVKMDDGLVRFDLNPNLGLDLVVTCHEVIVESIQPYDRDTLYRVE
ncbi:Imm50 family immunity protein [Paraburkholderia humisilvae]|nr:Imm50 family immunity protein [Paraburkholderia humisilvae]